MLREETVALRWMIHFLRVASADFEERGLPPGNRIAQRDVANPTARVRHHAFNSWLESMVQKVGDPCLGLRAAERCEAGDFDPIEFAMRTCATLRDAIACGARHVRLIHGE